MADRCPQGQHAGIEFLRVQALRVGIRNRDRLDTELAETFRE
jgi:hypothetical protein